MRTEHLASGGNYRGARSELQSGRQIPRERERRKERKTERERASLSRSDAIFTPIYGEIPGRGTLTTSKQDLWKTPGDLRYHYFPCGMSAGPTLPYRGYLDTFHKENLYSFHIDDIKIFK